MVVLRARSRLVTFRVSADEHETLTKSCLDYGSRSIAEFARAAVMQKVEMLHVPPGTLSGDLTTVSKGLRDLDLVLAEMRKRIRGLLGPAGSGLNSTKEGSAVTSEGK
jgi:hypothetical protein